MLILSTAMKSISTHTSWAVGDFVLACLGCACEPLFLTVATLEKAARLSTGPIRRSAPGVVRLHSPLSRGDPRTGLF